MYRISIMSVTTTSGLRCPNIMGEKAPLFSRKYFLEPGKSPIATAGSHAAPTSSVQRSPNLSLTS